MTNITKRKTTRTKRSLVPPAKAPTKKTAPAANPVAGKLGVIVDLLLRPQGAVLADIMKATGWQAHSVRGALSGALRRQRNLAIISEKTESGRVYRINSAAS